MCKQTIQLYVCVCVSVFTSPICILQTQREKFIIKMWKICKITGEKTAKKCESYFLSTHIFALVTAAVLIAVVVDGAIIKEKS